MKITWVLPVISIGGGVRVVLEYSNRLIEKGHEVNIIYPLIPTYSNSRSNLKNIAHCFIATAINFKRGKDINWFDSKSNLVRIPTLDSSFTKFIEYMIPEADIIIATSWETAYFVNNMTKTTAKKYYFVQSYEIWDIWQNEKCWEFIKQIEPDSNKWILKMSEVTPKSVKLRKYKKLIDSTYRLPHLRKITISSWLKELLETNFNQKVYGTIINGVNFEEFYCDNIDEKLKTAKSLTILSAIRGGSLLKGDFELLQSLRAIKDKCRDVNIVLYGTKGNIDIPSWIKFVNTPFGDDLRRLYSMAHIFISSSRLEGCQLPPMEAMACGCAVVATNVGGLLDYAINEETVLAVSPGNPEMISQKVIELVENDQKRRMIAKNGYEYIKQFTWSKATNDLENIFSN